MVADSCFCGDGAGLAMLPDLSPVEPNAFSKSLEGEPAIASEALDSVHGAQVTTWEQEGQGYGCPLGTKFPIRNIPMKGDIAYERAWDLIMKEIERRLQNTTMEELGKQLGVRKSAISRWKDGIRGEKVPFSNLVNYLDRLGIPITAVFDDVSPAQDDYDFVPKVKARAIGGQGGLEMEAEAEGMYAFRREWLVKQGGAKNLILLEARGESMEPTIKAGDTLLISRAEQDKDIISGEVYVVRVDNELMVKRVFREFGKCILRSDNENKSLFPQIIVPPGDESVDFEVIGRVKWLGRAFKNH